MLPQNPVLIFHKNVVALDPDIDEHYVEHYVLSLKPVLRATPMAFEPKQVHTASSPNTLTAQKDGK